MTELSDDEIKHLITSVITRELSKIGKQLGDAIDKIEARADAENPFGLNPRDVEGLDGRPRNVFAERAVMERQINRKNRRH